MNASIPVKSSMGSARCFSSKSANKSAATNNTEDKQIDGPYDYGYQRIDERFKDGKPTLLYAKAMPNDYASMRHEQILQLCAEGEAKAFREAVIRNVMAVDEVEYKDAAVTFVEISKVNRKWMTIDYIPYKIGLSAAVISGVASFPLVFHLKTVHAFNERYVTADIPEPKDLETWLEVGSWSWAW
eukprot:CAMPEP_0197826240 /NCGR_PEP_ID=MMETSP1437-20131217/3217_1 /TAXON_ID=49252 ORGANISM="Eucampia antarctica, Strain CCMP1452" /NCGR_SAMPLE_ID=MMETSP1437 /ASSEMBLY_ACC=CAM_ASM_001096 /LENGTH=184 /DNA_ID=CAMNT_0043426589 /DNA_START=179 /DNA_END=730 /DNA_ORIENTATION=-